MRRIALKLTIAKICTQSGLSVHDLAVILSQLMASLLSTHSIEGKEQEVKAETLAMVADHFDISLRVKEEHNDQP